MGQHKKFLYYFVLILVFAASEVWGRSPLRSDQKDIPHLIASWPDCPEKYHLKSWHIEENSIFHKFDRDYFMDHLLPQQDIPYRYEACKKVSGKYLGDLIENLVQEINAHKKEYTDFTILKKRDFNRKQCAGLLIVKFKNYPFVVKLFLETPQSFVKPFSKGWQSGCFFIMGGGINRYLSGFTRLRNREIIEQQIANDLYWKNKIGLPRKWGWLSKNTRWFLVEGINVGPRKHCSMEFPSIYAIVTDFIEGEPLSFWSEHDRKLGIKTAKFFTNRIDANIDNLVREPLSAYKNSCMQDGKLVSNSDDTDDTLPPVKKPTEPQLVLIDTEHFPTFVGLKKPLEFESYTEWYIKLTIKYLKDGFFRTKEERLAAACEEPYNLIPL